MVLVGPLNCWAYSGCLSTGWIYYLKIVLTRYCMLTLPICGVWIKSWSWKYSWESQLIIKFYDKFLHPLKPELLSPHSCFVKTSIESLFSLICGETPNAPNYATTKHLSNVSHPIEVWLLASLKPEIMHPTMYRGTLVIILLRPLQQFSKAIIAFLPYHYPASLNPQTAEKQYKNPGNSSTAKTRAK